MDRIEADAAAVTLFVRSSEAFAACSVCGTKSSRVHGRYRRSLADVPMAGRRTRIVAVVRRFKCGWAACPQTAFTEQSRG
ncbi:MAG: transposase family protein [Catenulispora sp.]|nr:transposase family protein [Catenulispora sp.]